MFQTDQSQINLVHDLDLFHLCSHDLSWELSKFIAGWKRPYDENGMTPL